MTARVTILGVFVADTTYRADRLPRMGETRLGTGFALGPGGKASNQAVAAALAGAETRLITRIGTDAFGQMARDLWRRAGVLPCAIEDEAAGTGAAFVFVEDGSGENAIIISPGAGARLSAVDVRDHAEHIRAADVFMTQLEQPVEAAVAALRIAREAGTRTVLNPAPAARLPEGTLELCDFVTPNESEAEGLTGIPVASLDDAARAADALLSLGAGAAIITLGENGAFYRDRTSGTHVPAFRAGETVETTGAGDAFNGAFAAALARGTPVPEAVRYGCAAAAISVTRPGTAASMPSRAEIDALLAAA